MSRHLPSRISHHAVEVFSPPPERFDEDVARLLNESSAVRYLTHEHSMHPAFLASLRVPGEDTNQSLAWTVDDVRERRAVQEQEHESRKSWHCIATEDGAFAGICSLRSIDWYNKSAEMGICLLSYFRHRPIIDQTHFCVLQHAFEELLLHRIGFAIVGENDSMKSYFNKVLGASHEGTLREAYLDNNGKYHDIELFSIIAPQWHGVKASLHRRIINASDDP